MTSWCSWAIGASASQAIRTLRRWFSAVIASPRRRRALPPRAVTISTALVPKRGDEERLDRVHPVFGLLEGDVVLALEHVVGDLEPVVEAEMLGDVLANL